MSNEFNFSFNLETSELNISQPPDTSPKIGFSKISTLFDLHTILYEILITYKACLVNVYGYDALVMHDKMREKIISGGDPTIEITAFINEITRIINLDREKTVTEEIDRLEKLCNNQPTE